MTPRWPDGPIVCFGDSYFEGTGARRGEDVPTLLAQALGLPVLNRGRVGQTAAEALPRLHRDVLDERPRLCLVEFGVNEAFRGLPVTACTGTLDRMLGELGRSGVPVLLVGVRFGRFQADFDSALRQLAQRNGCALVTDALRGVLDDPRLGDGSHPNGTGYRLLADRLLPEVQAILGRRKGQDTPPG